MIVSHFNGEMSFCNRRNSNIKEWTRMGTDEMEIENKTAERRLDTETI